MVAWTGDAGEVRWSELTSSCPLLLSAVSFRVCVDS
jgi:hypothetical protein